MTPIECSTLARTLRLGAIFRSLDLIHNTAVAVAAIDEILGLWWVLPDHRPLTAIGGRRLGPNLVGSSPDSPLEGNGFELPVPLTR